MYLSRKQKVGLSIFGLLGAILLIDGIRGLAEGRSDEVLAHLVTGILVTVCVLAIFLFAKIDSEEFEETGAITTVPVGDYLIGLPSVNRKVESVRCAVYPDRFDFMCGSRLLDSIPRNSVNQITVDSKSQITQRFTATRIAALGVFALAAPKNQRHQEFCLIIEWDDFHGAQTTVFEFVGEDAAGLANQAANTLKRYSKLRNERLKVSEKKCPFCAEMIKSEAKICRYCRSEVG
jgi:hypothetical protein